MNILVTNRYLKKIGGTEIYCYYLIKNLLQNHYVEYFTLGRGHISNMIEKNLNVKYMSLEKYDVILANHNNTIDVVCNKGFIIQTCHGMTHKDESPSKKCEVFVSISEEIKDKLLEKYNIKSTVINNGIDCDVYRPYKPINNKLKNVLSLCQSDDANKFIKICCDRLNLNFTYLNKHKNGVFNVCDYINDNDLVIGYGRSIYDAMSCGRPCIIYDKRPYQPMFSDGYVTANNVQFYIRNNCSGRYSKIIMTENDFICELKKYNTQDGNALRQYCLDNLDIKLGIKKYMDIITPYIC